MKVEKNECAVIGAGVSGLSVANELSNLKREVVVFEKARGVGGRLATRRFLDSVFDHGAQAFESSNCLLYTSPSPRDRTRSRMPSSA